jgi:hypothetical protein
MNVGKENGGLKQIKEAVRFRRETKDIAKEEGLRLDGVRDGKILDVQHRIGTVLEELKDHHADWIEKKQRQVADYLSPVKGSRVEKAFNAGLATTITQEVRTNRRVNRGTPLYTPEHLQNLVTGYTFDFYRSIRVSERLGIDPATAVDIARRSYNFNPDNSKSTPYVSNSCKISM